MKLLVAAVGRRMPAWVASGWLEYTRRLPADFSLTLVEIKPEDRRAGKTSAQMLVAEATRIRAVLPSGYINIALDENGNNWSTYQLAQNLKTWQENGSNVAFLIGGADGLDAGIKSQAQCWSLSALTMPHQLVRVILAEAVYRAVSLLQGHPYHRG